MIARYTDDGDTPNRAATSGTVMNSLGLPSDCIPAPNARMSPRPVCQHRPGLFCLDPRTAY
ncbi:hypothetical protein Aglo03_62580 [Actinokineospora globicatena]|uniref:Uncharacterized protein n=1 Tax=Actinokineospora globicatena TaxID=103729 RepID=A0A9W6QTU2_9PSEU|nr:hypothetical protein Aglo03_62580 [Actinokineospora globicatena]